MQENSEIWRNRSGGTNLERMTLGTSVNLFLNPSPDGRAVLYLSCVAGTEVHPRNPHVELRLLHLKDG